MKRMVTHHKRLQHYKRHYGMVCLTGLFGCRWHRYQQSTEDTPKCDLVWFAFFSLVSLFIMFWLYFWLITSNSEDLMNWYAYKHSGKWISWYTIILILTCITVAYIALLGILALCHIGHGHQLYMHHVHKCVLIIILLMGVAVGIGINAIWSPGWSLTYQSIMITGPWLHVAIVAAMTFLSWFIAGQWMLLYKTGAKIVWLGLFLALMILLYIFPCFIHSPCVVEPVGLPDKPFMLAHKGASSISPENTLIAFQKAAAVPSVITLESDVTISYDGVPFILHDRTLIRTTNVQEVFPESAHLDACRFNMSQLQQLDAGSWFAARDPFKTASSLTEAEKVVYANQTVIKLTDLLQVAKDHNKSVMFDIKFECKDHPYDDKYGEVIVDTILKSGFTPKQMWWLSKNRNISGSENFTLVWDKPESASFLLNKSVSHVNHNFNILSRGEVSELESSNISVNMYVVNAPWLFSLYWCMGVSSVTTDRATSFVDMSGPVWNLTPANFKIMWITTDCLSAVIIIVFFVIQRIRKSGKTFHGETISLQGAKVKMSHLKHNRNMKEKLLYTVESLQDLDVGINGIDSEPQPPTPQMARASLGCSTLGSINGDAVSIGTVSQGSVHNGGISMQNGSISHSSQDRTFVPIISNGVPQNGGVHTEVSQTSNGGGGSLVDPGPPQMSTSVEEDAMAGINRMSGVSGVSRLSEVSGLTEMSDTSDRPYSTLSETERGDTEWADPERGDTGWADPERGDTEWADPERGEAGHIHLDI